MPPLYFSMKPIPDYVFKYDVHYYQNCVPFFHLINILVHTCICVLIFLVFDPDVHFILRYLSTLLLINRKLFVFGFVFSNGPVLTNKQVTTLTSYSPIPRMEMPTTDLSYPLPSHNYTSTTTNTTF